MEGIVPSSIFFALVSISMWKLVTVVQTGQRQGVLDDRNHHILFENVKSKIVLLVVVNFLLGPSCNRSINGWWSY